MLLEPNDCLLSDDSFVPEDLRVLAKFWDGENIPYHLTFPLIVRKESQHYAILQGWLNECDLRAPFQCCSYRKGSCCVALKTNNNR